MVYLIKNSRKIVLLTFFLIPIIGGYLFWYILLSFNFYFALFFGGMLFVLWILSFFYLSRIWSRNVPGGMVIIGVIHLLPLIPFLYLFSNWIYFSVLWLVRKTDIASSSMSFWLHIGNLKIPLNGLPIYLIFSTVVLIPIAYGLLICRNWVRKVDMVLMCLIFLISLLFSILSLLYGLKFVVWGGGERETISLTPLSFLPLILCYLPTFVYLRRKNIRLWFQGKKSSH